MLLSEIKSYYLGKQQYWNVEIFKFKDFDFNICTYNANNCLRYLLTFSGIFCKTWSFQGNKKGID